MLYQVLKFIRQENYVSIQQLSRYFHIAPEALEPILKIWIAKGRILACNQQPACKSQCFKCKVDNLTFYQYQSDDV